ncbi:ATP-dependent helicase HrpB [Aneurinibacillus tyrosinisolvens]|uniref:ATP-dependent helicase HrpB n=1 Tax=Aneurinibacillus tyrosinisolvens TaxID=1443435 RepID=UPI00063F57D1|nr:ATP-dependent helicase HrpB [Aneurinibacillus tyrosinisolvens]
MTQLPIERVLPELKNVLDSHNSGVLVAPPGAGKTTRIPLSLLDEPWLAGRRILMLEPRRLAARTAAHYMAASLGEHVGETVGYRVKLDAQIGEKTRIEVITEGILTRLLQADPALEGVGLVVFDEFHERSIHADLGLALCLESQAVLREDLRILVMSATLDAEPVAALLGDAPVIVSEGKAFPVETRYVNRPMEGRMEAVVTRTIVDALESEEGSILVFLPGAGEIRKIESLLLESNLEPHVRVAPLYGSLTREAQDLAISPGMPGERKIVLATSIAETSLTVEGVRTVIDSGLMRTSRFSPRTGMAWLETVQVSRASADQRCGRAGRQGPGVCYRLWTEQENRSLALRSIPEILEADLAPLALELAAWGASAPAQLPWLDPPPAAAFAEARKLLSQLGALDEGGMITAHGRRMAELGMHPRLAHMVLKAADLGYGETGCELAAILSERDFFRYGKTAPDADIRLRIEVLRSLKREGQTKRARETNIDWTACRRILSEADYWKRIVRVPAGGKDDDINACGLLLAFAYPDRIARLRSSGRFLLRSGRGAVFSKTQPLSNAAYVVAAELDGQGPESRIYLAAPLNLDDVERHFGNQMEEEAFVDWDPAAQAVRARKRRRLGALVLSEVPLSEPDPERCLEALLRGIGEEGLEILPWTKAARQLRQRLHFMHRYKPERWPDVSGGSLTATMEEWLAPHLYGYKSRADLQKINVAGILESMLSWEQRRELDEYAPTHIVVPSGTRLPVDYSDPASPVLAVRLQEMFGLKETPRIAGGSVPLTLHLLSPAQRPVQVTRDLGSFWRNAYFEVKKDLKGRYPKHYWPDNPLEAIPTSRTRPRE